MLVWWLSDNDRLRTSLEQFLNQALESPVTLSGDIDLSLGSNIDLCVEQLHWKGRIADSRKVTTTIDHLCVNFRATSLVFGPFAVNYAHLKHLTATIDEDPSPASDWFKLLERAAQSEQLVASEHLPFVIGRLQVDDVKVEWQHPSLTDRLFVQTQDTELSVDRAGSVQLDSRLTLGQQSLFLNASAQLATATRGNAVDISLSGELGTLELIGERSVEGQELLSLRSKVRSADIAPLIAAFKLPLTTEGELAIDAEFSREEGGLVGTFGGVAGAYRVSASIATRQGDTGPEVSVDLNSVGPSANEIGKLLGLGYLPSDNYQLATQLVQSASAITIIQLEMKSGGLSIDTSGIIGVGSTPVQTSLSLNAKGPDVAVIGQLVSPYFAVWHQPFDINMRIQEVESDQKEGGIKGKLNVGRTLLSVDGTLSTDGESHSASLRFGLETEEASLLATTFEVPLGLGDKAQLQGNLEIEDKTLSFSRFDIRLEQARFVGDAKWAMNKEDVGIQINGTLSGENLNKALLMAWPKLDWEGLPVDAYRSDINFSLDSANGRLGVPAFTVGDHSMTLKLNTAHAQTGGAVWSGQVSANGKNLSDWMGGNKDTPVLNGEYRVSSKVIVMPGKIQFRDLGLHHVNLDLLGSFSIGGDGWGNTEFSITGRGSTLSNIVSAFSQYKPSADAFEFSVDGKTEQGKTYLENLSLAFDTARLKATGFLNSKPDFVVEKLKVAGSDISLNALGLNFVPPDADVLFDINTIVDYHSGIVTANQLEIIYEDGTIIGDVKYEAGKETPMLQLQLHSDKLNLDGVLGRPESKSSAMLVSQDDNKFFSRQPLPVERLKELNGSISLTVDELLYDQKSWRDIDIKAELTEGVLNLDKASVVAAQGEVELRGTARPDLNGLLLQAEISAAHAMLVRQGSMSEEIERLPHHALKGEITATGRSPHELAATSQGFIWMLGGQGEVKRSAMSPLIGDFLSELLATLNPVSSTRDNVSRVDCLGAYLEIENGIMKTAPALVYQTEDLVGLASGTIDLGAENLDLVFETTPRKGVGISIGDYAQPFVKIGGTFSHPKMMLNPQGALIEGGAAIATTGLSVVAKNLWKRFVGNKEVCAKVAEKASETRADREPGNVPSLDALLNGTLNPVFVE
ncbi:MAG: hypothetical protein ACWA5Q_07020 [bacterium]